MGLRADNLRTHVVVAAWEWPSYMDPEARDRGIKVRTSSYTRHHVNISMCKAKATGNYINSLLALREADRERRGGSAAARQRGLCRRGQRGKLLHGARQHHLHAGAHLLPRGHHARYHFSCWRAELGYEIRERRITRDEVYVADEAFFTGTAAEVVPIRMSDGRTMGSGRRGPLTTELQARYFDLVRGKRADYPEWRAPVAG